MKDDITFSIFSFFASSYDITLLFPSTFFPFPVKETQKARSENLHNTHTDIMQLGLQANLMQCEQANQRVSRNRVPFATYRRREEATRPCD